MGGRGVEAEGSHCDSSQETAGQALGQAGKSPSETTPRDQHAAP